MGGCCWEAWDIQTKLKSGERVGEHDSDRQVQLGGPDVPWKLYQQSTCRSGI